MNEEKTTMFWTADVQSLIENLATAGDKRQKKEGMIEMLEENG